MKKITDFVNGRGDAGTVYLFGGEPLLYKDEVMFFCENLIAKQIVITTNGTLLDEEFIKWCIDRKVIINMSHDGSECDERGADRELLDANLKLLLKYQPETLVQLVYTKSNLSKLYDNIMYLKGLGVKKVSAAMDAFLVPDDPDSFGDLLREQWEKIAGIQDLFVYELALKKKNIKENKKSSCELCRKKLFINWDGKFYPCIQFQNIPEYRCGDLTVGIEAEKARKAAKRAESRSAFGELIRKIVRFLTHNNIVISKEGEEFASIPLLAVLIICSISVGLAVVAVFVSMMFGYEYSFRGESEMNEADRL